MAVQTGRFQVSMADGSGRPFAVLVDTTTGRSWLYNGTNAAQPVWLPMTFTADAPAAPGAPAA